MKELNKTETVSDVGSSVLLDSKKDAEEYGWKMINCLSSLVASTEALIKKIESLEKSISEAQEEGEDWKKQ